MSDILAKICKDKLEWIASAKANRPESSLILDAKSATNPRSFSKALDRSVRATGTGLIAEIKKASPSKGLIRNNFAPSVLASEYEKGGAACLSVLTDKAYFQGDSSDLLAARNAVKIPVLRKDFILDTYQIIESRSIGADCILLIMSAITDNQAGELAACAMEFGMDLLIEVHDKAELARALIMPPALIGINNRNLKTLDVNLTKTEELAPEIPDSWTIVCESGIYTREDIKRMKRVGVHRFLVGESLMRKRDIVMATRSLLGTSPQDDINLRGSA